MATYKIKVSVGYPPNVTSWKIKVQMENQEEVIKYLPEHLKDLRVDQAKRLIIKIDKE